MHLKIIASHLSAIIINLNLVTSHNNSIIISVIIDNLDTYHNNSITIECYYCCPGDIAHASISFTSYIYKYNKLPYKYCNYSNKDLANKTWLLFNYMNCLDIKQVLYLDIKAKTRKQSNCIATIWYNSRTKQSQKLKISLIGL